MAVHGSEKKTEKERETEREAGASRWHSLDNSPERERDRKRGTVVGMHDKERKREEDLSHECCVWRSFIVVRLNSRSEEGEFRKWRRWTPVEMFGVATFATRWYEISWRKVAKMAMIVGLRTYRIHTSLAKGKLIFRRKIARTGKKNADEIYLSIWHTNIINIWNDINIWRLAKELMIRSHGSPRRLIDRCYTWIICVCVCLLNYILSSSLLPETNSYSGRFARES